MFQHPNARLTPLGRRRVVERVESGASVSAAAREAGVSRQTAHKWLARARAGESLADRRSRPRSCPRRTDPGLEALVVSERASRRCGLTALSAATGVPARTCARIVARAGLPRLSELDPVTGERLARGPVTRLRYERERPGDLVHVDVKKLAAVPEGGGYRARGPAKRERAGSGLGMVCLHVAVDDGSRVAYAEALGDERAATCAGFLGRALAFYASVGVGVREVMTDNGPAYRSRELNGWLAARGVGHVYTRPYSPWQNGKVERMNRTLAQEWAYARPYASESEREEALAGFLRYYNRERPHSACGGRPPMSRLCQQPIGS